MQPPKKKSSLPTKSKTPPAAVHIDPGEAAFDALRSALLSLPTERIGPPRADVRAAASFVLSDTMPRLSDATLRSRLLSLPKTEFDHSAIDSLPLAAQAVLWAQTQLAESEAGPSSGRLPPALVSSATALRQNMIEVCAYHFRHDVRLQAQIDDIRGGQGYLDLAEDLRRLAALYRSEHKTLSADTRFYQKSDADQALHFAQRIVSELRPVRSDAAREQVFRTFALLLKLYEEVARAARFLLRESGDTAFPSLYTASRTFGRRKGAAKPTEPLPSPAARDADKPAD